MSYQKIFANMISAKRLEEDVRAVCGEVTPAGREWLDEQYKEAKQETRRVLATIKDPLATSIRKGGKRSFTSGDRQITFWIEKDIGESDGELSAYVQAVYSYHTGPGGLYQEADWKRTRFGLLIVLTEGRDV